MYGYTHDQIITDEIPLEDSYEVESDEIVEEDVVENDDIEGVINYSSVNVRSTPVKESGVNNIFKSLTKGTTVYITESTPDDKWYKIYFDGGSGYIMQEFVDLV